MGGEDISVFSCTFYLSSLFYIITVVLPSSISHFLSYTALIPPSLSSQRTPHARQSAWDFSVRGWSVREAQLRVRRSATRSICTTRREPAHCVFFFFFFVVVVAERTVNLR